MQGHAKETPDRELPVRERAQRREQPGQVWAGDGADKGWGWPDKGLIRAAYPRGVTLTVICARRPVWKLLTSPFMLSMALGISPGVGGASSTLA